MRTLSKSSMLIVRRACVVSGLALSLAAGLAPGLASAQTLQDALVQAYQNNPQLQAERANLRATDENVPQALANWRPTVSLTASQAYSHIDSTSRETTVNSLNQTTTSDVSGSSSNLPQTYGVSISQPIYRGGRTVAQTAEALNLVQAERARLVLEEETILLAVATDYMNVVRDQATVDLDVNNEQVLKKQLEQVQDQFRVGEVTRTDVAQAEASYAQAIATRQAAEGTLQVDRANFERDVGVPPGKLAAPTGLPPLPTTRDASINLAATGNPNVIAAQFTQQAGEDNIKVIRGALLPQVGLTASLTHSKDSSSSGSNGERADDASIVAQLTVPLYEGGSIYSETRQAQQTVAQRKSLVDDARRAAAQSAATFWEQITSDRATIVSLQAAIRANEISLDGTRQEAAVGQRTVLDILNAEQTLLQSRVNLVSSQHDEIVAELSLASAIGALTAKSLALPVELYDPDKNFEAVRDKWIGFGTAE